MDGGSESVDMSRDLPSDLGSADSNADVGPPDLPPPLFTWKHISRGVSTTCGIGEDDYGYCWGFNARTSGWDMRPKLQSAVKYTTIAVGNLHVCAVRSEDTQVECWGGNGVGQVDPAMPTAGPVTTPSSPFQKNILRLDAGDFHTCARAADGELWCWGHNRNRQVGHPTADVAVYVVQAGAGTEAIVAGARASCGIFQDKEIHCWGQGDGYLTWWMGDQGSPSELDTPEVAAFSDLDVGKEHGCAIAAGTGGLYCWGFDRNTGKIGSMMSDGTSTLVAVALGSAKKVSVGVDHSCAIDGQDRLHCWGANEAGELGVGEPSSYTTAVPRLVLEDVRFKELAAGGAGTCAISMVGELFCWGSNTFGEVGSGTRGAGESLPVRVLPPP